MKICVAPSSAFKNSFQMVFDNAIETSNEGAVKTGSRDKYTILLLQGFDTVFIQILKI